RTAPYPRLSALAALAGDGPVADIVAVEHAVPANLLGQAVGLLLGIGDAGTDGGGAQHAAAGGDDLAVLQCGAGVEHLAVELGGVIQAFDHVTLGVVARVAAGGQHHAHGRTRVPGRLDLVQ